MESSDGHKCRDVRYKFDKEATGSWLKAKVGNKVSERELVTLLESAGLSPSSGISELEFEDLIQRYNDTRNKCKTLLEKATSKTLSRSDLKIIWQPRLSSLVTTPSGAPVVVRSGVNSGISFPNTKPEANRWLHGVISPLRPNLKRRLKQERDQVVDTLLRYSSRYGNEVFVDFLERVENDASLRWNDIRVGRILDTLMRKWNPTNLEITHEPEED